MKIDVQMGTDGAGTDDAGWNLNVAPPGGSSRVYQKQIAFSPRMRSVPVVKVGLTHIDCVNPQLRIDVRADQITQNGFMLRIETWFDSTLNGVRVDWTAIAYWG